MKTISDHLSPYRAFLSGEKQRVAALIHQAEAENRQDEANLLKIRLNILGVFETVASADEKQTADWPSFRQRYEPRFDTLTAPWRARLAQAMQHGDLQTQTIEEEKLAATNQIKSVFLSIGE